jgi:hypothetical protein
MYIDVQAGQGRKGQTMSKQTTKTQEQTQEQKRELEWRKFAVRLRLLGFDAH